MRNGTCSLPCGAVAWTVPAVLPEAHGRFGWVCVRMHARACGWKAKGSPPGRQAGSSWHGGGVQPRWAVCHFYECLPGGYKGRPNRAHRGGPFSGCHSSPASRGLICTGQKAQEGSGGLSQPRVKVPRGLALRSLPWSRPVSCRSPCRPLPTPWSGSPSLPRQSHSLLFKTNPRAQF